MTAPPTHAPSSGEAQRIEALTKALRDLREACYRASAREELGSEIDGSLIDAATDALEPEFPIIWTPEQVEMLKARQENPRQHPYTCGGNRSDAAHRALAEEDGDRDTGLLVPTVRGWFCPACDYRQFWSHETGGPAAAPSPPQADHVERVWELASRIVLDVSELPDRTSPVDWPDAMLVTADELTEIIESHLASISPPAEIAPVGDLLRFRPEVAAFAVLMERQLRENDHKPGWKSDSPEALLERCRQELKELTDAVSGYAFSRSHSETFIGTASEAAYLERMDAVSLGLGREAADVANFAMMIADVCAALSPPAVADPGDD